jgi:hypothetical protein
MVFKVVKMAKFVILFIFSPTQRRKRAGGLMGSFPLLNLKEEGMGE